MITPSGILLPHDTITSTTMQALAAVVAFNSLVFVGMTVAKLIPWPKQFHPDWVAGRLGSIGVVMTVDDSWSEAKRGNDSRVNGATLPTEPDSAAAVRNAILVRDTPYAICALGFSTFVLAAVEITLLPNSSVDGAYQIPLSVIWFILGIGLARSAVPATARSWIWVTAVCVQTCWLAVSARNELDVAILLPLLLLMVAYIPLTLLWRPVLVSAVVVGGLYLAYTTVFDGLHVGWTLAGVFALLTGMILLKLRLVALTALADERARLTVTSVTDLVTGVYSRSGASPLVSGIASTCLRRGQACVAMVIHCNNYKQLLSLYGHAYADEVACALAAICHQNAPVGDVVIRWDSGTFVIVGVMGDPDALRQHITEDLTSLSITLGRQNLMISMATAVAAPDSATL